MLTKYGEAELREHAADPGRAKWIDVRAVVPILDAKEAQLAALQRENDQLKRERDGLREAVKDLAGKFAWLSNHAHDAGERAAYEDATNQVFDIMHELPALSPTPPEDKP